MATTTRRRSDATTEKTEKKTPGKRGPNRTPEQRQADALEAFRQKQLKRKGKGTADDVVERRENPTWPLVRKLLKTVDDIKSMVKKGELVGSGDEDSETLVGNCDTLRGEIRSQFQGIRLPSTDSDD